MKYVNTMRALKQRVSELLELQQKNILCRTELLHSPLTFPPLTSLEGEHIFLLV